MRRLSTIGLMVCLISALGIGASWAQEDIQKHPSCSYCGMNRQQFAHSRVFIDYDDGSTAGTCSIHCAAIDLALHIDKTPRIIWVGDFNSKQLVDAEKAAWVIGGNKPGVMTKRAKWAFSSKAEAERFVKENGGALAGFEEVVKASYEDMYTDTKMIREKRKMRRQHAPEPGKKP